MGGNKRFLEDKLQARPGYEWLARNKARERGHRAVQDLCALLEPASGEGQALAFWKRARPTNMPKLAALVMLQVKHAIWCVLTMGSPSLAMAGAVDTRSAERAGAHLLHPGPLAKDELPLALAPVGRTVLPKQ